MNAKEISKWYRDLAKDVVKLNLYNDFIDQGWTIKLSQKAQNKLSPILINAVTKIWYNAYLDSTMQGVKDKKQHLHFDLNKVELIFVKLVKKLV